jgi:hypothetical protein
MILPTLANVELPSALVASVIAICLTFLINTSLKRQKPEELLKLLNVFTGAAGLLLGVFITYFFTRETTQAKIQTVQARSEAELRFAQTELNAYKTASEAVKSKLSPEDAEWLGAITSKLPAMGSKWGKWPETPTPTPLPSSTPHE